MAARLLREKGVEEFGGGGSGVVAIAEAKRAPEDDLNGGGILYVEGGALTYRSPSGIVTILAKP
jgi:hypothetical protein